MSHRLLEELVSYLVLLKSKTFSASGFTRIWEVSRQSKKTPSQGKNSGPIAHLLLYFFPAANQRWHSG